MLFSLVKEWNFAICNMSGLGGYYGKWNKSERERKKYTVWYHLYMESKK